MEVESDKTQCSRSCLPRIAEGSSGVLFVTRGRKISTKFCHLLSPHFSSLNFRLNINSTFMFLIQVSFNHDLTTKNKFILSESTPSAKIKVILMLQWNSVLDSFFLIYFSPPKKQNEAFRSFKGEFFTIQVSVPRSAKDSAPPSTEVHDKQHQVETGYSLQFRKWWIRLKGQLTSKWKMPLFSLTCWAIYLSILFFCE